MPSEARPARRDHDRPDIASTAEGSRFRGIPSQEVIQPEARCARSSRCARFRRERRPRVDARLRRASLQRRHRETSRFRPQPLDGKHGLLLSASPSLAGGNRGLWSLRIPLEHLGSRVFPDMFSLAMAHKAFVDDGIADAALRARFEKNVQAFLSLAEAAKHYPCMKRAWIELC